MKLTRKKIRKLIMETIYDNSKNIIQFPKKPKLQEPEWDHADQDNWEREREWEFEESEDNIETLSDLTEEDWDSFDRLASDMFGWEDDADDLLRQELERERNIPPDLYGDAPEGFYEEGESDHDPFNIDSPQNILTKPGLKPVNESLSRGSMYRKRYYGRY